MFDQNRFNEACDNYVKAKVQLLKYQDIALVGRDERSDALQALLWDKLDDVARTAKDLDDEIAKAPSDSQGELRDDYVLLTIVATGILIRYGDIDEGDEVWFSPYSIWLAKYLASVANSYKQDVLVEAARNAQALNE